MIVAILVMFGAWLALGFFINGRQTGWASGFFFIAIARVLLIAGLVVCLPGGIAVLVMALILKSMGLALRVICILLALLALGLPFAMSPLKKARDKRRFDEIMNSGSPRKMIEAAESETPKEKPAGER